MTSASATPSASSASASICARQDVARRARVSRQLVGRLERGAAGRYPLDATSAVAAALGIRLDVRPRWQGADLDRLVNAAHAELHESVAARLGELAGWTWLPRSRSRTMASEASSTSWRGMPSRGACSSSSSRPSSWIPRSWSPRCTAAYAWGRIIAREHGWDPVTVSAWVIVRSSRTERRRLHQHEGLLRAAFPRDGRTMRRWLRDPGEPVSALSFWTDVTPGGLRQAHRPTKRVRRPARGYVAAVAKRESIVASADVRRRPAARDRRHSGLTPPQPPIGTTTVGMSGRG